MKEYKLACEANIVSIIYKENEYIYNAPLNKYDFDTDEWRVYYSIANGLLIEEKKNSLDEITIGLYLEKHLKLKEKYELFGGYKTISNAMSYVNTSNFDSYISELGKWKALISLSKNGFLVGHRLSDYADMSVEDIYNELDAVLNNSFISVDSDVVSLNPLKGLDDLVSRLNDGENVGMPINNMPTLNKEMCGINFNGHIYALGAPSGMGKSTTAINFLLPSVMKYNEKIIFIINEEDVDKIQKELIVWVANNIYKEELHKYTLNNGKFTNETKELLKKCIKWLEEKDNDNILVIPLSHYNTDRVIKIIRKYSSIGCRLFVLDTFKEGDDVKNEKTWKAMERDAVKLYDCIKPASKNVALFLTYQVAKGSIKTRHYTNFDIGQAKSIVDVFSVNIMMRKPFDDEYEGGRRAITVEKRLGDNIRSKIRIQLSNDKHYMIFFICKNRFGATDPYQIVAEYNLSTNTYEEIGITHIPEDY